MNQEEEKRPDITEAYAYICRNKLSGEEGIPGLITPLGTTQCIGTTLEAMNMIRPQLSQLIETGMINELRLVKFTGIETIETLLQQ